MLHEEYIKIVDKDFKHKCDASNFNTDKDKVKIYNFKEKSFIRCHTFDKNHWTLLDSCKIE